MTFQSKKIPYREHLKILERAEAQLIDFKDKRIKPAKLSKTVSAFANSDGGEIFVGITEQSEGEFIWNGFKREEQANQIIQSLDSILYLKCHYHADFLYFDREEYGLILMLTISKSNSVIYTTSKEVYVRRNAQDVKLKNRQEIRQLELNKGVFSYEDYVIDASLGVVSNSDTIYKFLLDGDFDTEPEDFLSKNNLIEEAKPRVSAVLLFGDNPQSFINRCGVKIVRYNTSAETQEREDMMGQPITKEGCLYDLIYSTVEEVENLVKKIPSDQTEKLAYPRETLHEIIANAILHRDYSIKDDIQIRVFNNRIEIESPGLLPGDITVENILSQRYSRNGTIVRIINKFKNPPNKDIGEGLNTAFEAMRMSGLISPVIKQINNRVVVIVKSEKRPDGKKVFLNLLQTHRVFSTRQVIMKKVFSTEPERKKVLKQLQEKGVIEKVPNTHGVDTEYRLTNEYKALQGLHR